MMPSTLRTAVAGAFLLGACTGDSPGEPGASVFEGEMTGAYTATLNGEAVFGVTIDERAKGSGLALILGDGGAGRILLVSTGTPRPPARTYEILPQGFAPVDDTVFTGTVGYLAGGALEQFEVRGGTITLTRSDHNAVTGQFELRAVRTSPCCDTDPVQIFITGTFNAGQVPQSHLERAQR